MLLFFITKCCCCLIVFVVVALPSQQMCNFRELRTKYEVDINNLYLDMACNAVSRIVIVVCAVVVVAYAR